MIKVSAVWVSSEASPLGVEMACPHLLSSVPVRVCVQSSSFIYIYIYINLFGCVES